MYVSFYTVTLFYSREREMVVDMQGKKKFECIYVCMWAQRNDCVKQFNKYVPKNYIFTMTS